MGLDLGKETATIAKTCSYSSPQYLFVSPGKTVYQQSACLVSEKLTTNCGYADPSSSLNRRKSAVDRGRYGSATQEDIHLTTLNPNYLITPIPATVSISQLNLEFR